MVTLCDSGVLKIIKALALGSGGEVARDRRKKVRRPTTQSWALTGKKMANSVGNKRWIDQLQEMWGQTFHRTRKCWSCGFETHHEKGSHFTSVYRCCDKRLFDKSEGNPIARFD